MWNEIRRHKNMKKIIPLVFVCGMTLQTGLAQTLPKWAGKARKAVFSVITYGKDNKILNTGNGFYIDENGTAVSDYSLFKGADHAVVVTADGKELPVTYILGANDMFDVVKFQTATDKKCTALTPAAQPGVNGQTVYLLPYSTQNKADGQKGTITQTDSIENNSFYYTLEMTTTDKTVSCPIMNEAGEVLGLIQKNMDETSESSYAIGINYAKSLSIGALSVNDPTLHAIGIRKGLPEDESQALVFLYMASSQLSSDEYLELLNEFIRKYPGNSEGYSRRANLYISMDDEAHRKLADEDLKKMLDTSENKAEGHYGIAKQIYNYVLSLNGEEPYGNWTLDRALAEVNEALGIDNQGLYSQLQGDIYFALQKYPEAFASYDAVNRSPLASATSFYSAAKAKELMGGGDGKKEAIALMDSVVARFNTPYGSDAAPYLYERARMKSEDGQYREAVKDYNAFYEAMMGQVTAEFYLIREQSEMQCRMYQQAINDINKAVEMDADNAGYWIEKGSVHLRVNQLEEAVKALQKATGLDTQNGSAYRMMGYAQIKLGNQKEGMTNLEKALQLGDTVAADLIKKYKK